MRFTIPIFFALQKYKLASKALKQHFRAGIIQGLEEDGETIYCMDPEARGLLYFGDQAIFYGVPQFYATRLPQGISPEWLDFSWDEDTDSVITQWPAGLPDNINWEPQMCEDCERDVYNCECDPDTNFEYNM